MGGGEFAIRVEDVPNPNAHVVKPAGRIQSAIAEPLMIEGHEVHADTSTGVEPFDADAQDRMQPPGSRHLHASTEHPAVVPG